MHAGCEIIHGLKRNSAIHATAGTGMPEGPAATAPTAIAQEYWPVVSTPLGDNRRRAMEKKAYKLFFYEVRKVMMEWPILRAKHVVKLAQTQTEPRERVPPYIYDDIIERIEKGDTWFKFIVDEYVTISLRGSERIPREKYNEIMQTVEKVFLNENEINTMITIISMDFEPKNCGPR